MRLLPFLLLAGACEPGTSFELDCKPLLVDTSGGLLELEASAPEIAGLEDPLPAILDTGSPLTMFDTGGDTRRRNAALLLHAAATTGWPIVARARFPGVSGVLGPVGQVGLGTPHDVAVVVGADVLLRVDLRLELAAGRITFFPDLPGDSTYHENECSTILPIRVAGGGRIDVGGVLSDLAATRVPLDACLVPPVTDCVAANDPPGCVRPTSGGTDALLVLSTGVPLTTLSRTAYLRATGLADADLLGLPTSRLFLPGGAADGEVVLLGGLPGLALTGDALDARGPCAELWVSRTMAIGGSISADRPKACGEEFLCTAAASVETTAPLTVAIVDDTHPLLQGLRAELRPGEADVDGVLGLDFFAPYVADLDYPNRRVRFTCADSATCLLRPYLTGDRLAELQRRGCLPL